MTLRTRLTCGYSAIAIVCMILLGVLAHHQFWTEVEMHQWLGPKGLPNDRWSGTIASSVYSLVPAVLGAGWLLMRRILEPILRLTEAVGRIHTRNLNEPLPCTGSNDEVDRLAQVFNAMVARIDQSFQQIREFTLHASHELKTPLTVMRGELETALHDSDSLPPVQREWMQSQLDEIQRLAKIVDGLTLLTKADAGQVEFEWEPVWVEDLVRECVEDAKVLAEPQHVTVTLGECADVVTLGDRHRLRQILLNLVDNAIKYNKPNGTVTVDLRAVGEELEIEIINTGAGIPPELQARIFDRFVRGDEARSKSIDGCGLGLAIVRWIVQTHCGNIQITSEPEKTTKVLIRLPKMQSKPRDPPREEAASKFISHGI